MKTGIELKIGDKYEKGSDIEFPCLFVPTEFGYDNPNFKKAFLTECKIRGAGHYYKVVIQPKSESEVKEDCEKHRFICLDYPNDGWKQCMYCKVLKKIDYPKSESRMYTEDEVANIIDKYMDYLWDIDDANPMTVQQFIQSLKPKTEEQTYGEWMRSDPERPLYDFPNKKICFKSCEQSTIDLGNCDCHNRIMDRFLMPNKEQPTSPSLEKMAELKKEFLYERHYYSSKETLWEFIEKVFQEGYNNSLEDLEKWVKEEVTKNNGAIYVYPILDKIQELKTKQ